MKLPRIATISVFVVSISLLVAIVSGVFVNKLVLDDAVAGFDDKILGYQYNISEKFDDYSRLVDVLESFVISSDEVTYDEWVHFGTNLNLVNSYKGISSMVYVEPVRIEDFDEYKDQLVNNSEIRPLGDLETQSVGFILKYIYPTDDQRTQTIGFDIFTEEIRKDTIIRSIKEDQSRSTGLTKFGNGEYGVILYSPVFGNDKEEIRALISLSFRIEELGDALSLELVGLQNYCFDVEDSDGHSLYRFESFQGVNCNYFKTQTLHLAGDDYNFVIGVNKESLVTSFSSTIPLTIAVGVFIFVVGINTILFSFYINAKKAETTASITSKKLSENKNILKELIDNYESVVFVVDRSRKIIIVNDEFEKLSNIQRNEASGKKIDLLYPLDDFGIWEELFEKCVTKKINCNFDLKSKNNILNIFMFPLLDKDGDVFAIATMAFDVSESRKLQQELEDRNKELEKYTKLMVGRELKMAELKKVIKEKEEQLKKK